MITPQALLPSHDVFSPGPFTPAAAKVRKLITPEMVARVRALGLDGEGISPAMMAKVKALLDNGESPTLTQAIRLAGGRVNEVEWYRIEIEAS